MNPVLRVQLLVGLMCLALFVYFAILARTATAMLRTGSPTAVALGVGVLAMPVVGVWAMFATLRAGVAHHRLARRAEAEGMELDLEDMPRMPSGRIRREAADAVVQQVRREVDSHPGDWRRWYRLACAYECAGDRRSAREAMHAAVAFESAAQ